MWNSYESFASTTELHGFDMIVKYKERTFLATLWTCLTAVAVIMCVNDAVNLVVLYKSEPTAISVSLAEYLNLSLPNPTLCMEVHVDPPMMAQTIAYTYSADAGKVKYLTTEEIQRQIDQDMNVFLIATDNCENLDLTTYSQLSLSQYLEYYTYLMLSYITEAELTYIGYDNKVLKYYETLYANQYPKNVGLGPFPDVAVNATIGYVYSLYVNRNVSIANLKRLVGMSICQKRAESLISKKNGVAESHPICQPNMITHLSFSKVCSKLFETDLNQMSYYDSFTLSGIKPVETLFWLGSRLVCPFTFSTSKVTFSWYLDFYGRNVLPIDNRQGIFGWNPTVSAAVEVSVGAEYHFYSRAGDPCSNAELTYACEWRHRIERFQRTCGCRASSFLDYDIVDMSLPLCGEDAPLWILQNNSANVVVDASFVWFSDQSVPSFNDISCVRNCDVTVFAVVPKTPVNILTVGYTSLKRESAFVEFAFRTTGNRTIFAETPSKSFNSFVFDFGGSIGAWLGASLMAFVHAIFHIILACREVAGRVRKRIA